MSYSAKTYNKCSFVNLKIDPLKPLAKSSKKKKQKKRFNEDKTKILSEWRDSWFKGKYERPTKLL